ncbi:TIGR00730 family Rossman fold protein [Agromyces sp. SYSU K20354]|uniref:LOG family protein n=1 Tax=Agromyces cavernae TaxID=2898659 RepID=UPI001E29B99C|nr:TIGR00730 family Rossman fold protein [Agromyces cavernae]MCD2443876.1 TIGR00730 family Rossman fold protein [Agromyces cavernae]
MTVQPQPSAGENLSDQLLKSVDALLDQAGIRENRSLIERILLSGLRLGTDGTRRLDLKITAVALEEMRDAFRLFEPYTDVPKVTVFGSARTSPSDPSYRQAHELATALARDGWMVVTGAGPGIMEAASTGAGPGRALGVSIRLPFEEEPNAAIAAASRVTMKYFFIRKLMLVKESRGFVCLPGGFGTLDETFELLTLQQTGKAEPMPIVLLDPPGVGFWEGLRRFVDDTLVPAGVISRDDLDRVLVTDSVAEAAREITGFWRNYDSLRWVGSRLVLRLNAAPSDAEIDGLNERFGELLATGRIERTEPLRPEREDGDALNLARIVLVPDGHRVGRLHRLIRALNELPSAPAVATPPLMPPSPG